MLEGIDTSGRNGGGFRSFRSGQKRKQGGKAEKKETIIQARVVSPNEPATYHENRGKITTGSRKDMSEFLCPRGRISEEDLFRDLRLCTNCGKIPIYFLG